MMSNESLRLLLAILMTILVSHQSTVLNPCKAGGYQGDAALSDEDLKRFSRSYGRSRRAVTSEEDRKWLDGVIPYRIDDAFNGKEKNVIQKAIRHWESNTCLSFIERTNEDEYVTFQNDGDCGCCSYVGRMGAGQAQGVNLGRECIKMGTIAHEIGHVIGFWHEHTRPDRDLYVDIFKRNILDSELKNFRKLSKDEINSFGIKYDFGSIMHYASNTFSRNGFDITIRPRPGIIARIGQRQKLSPLDIKQAKLLYRCANCGKTFSESHSNFSFLTSDLKVLKPTTCEWRIIGTSGEKIYLHLKYVNFKYNCRKVYLEVRDGKHRNAPLLGRYCKGKKPPPKIVSNSASLWIRFHYGHKYFYSGNKPIGVKASYDIVCGGVIEKEKGFIQSPNYPEYYEMNKNCTWRIIVPKGYKVALSFQMFHVEKSSHCAYDHVEIIDDMTRNSLGRFCGSSRPKKQITSSGNSVTVNFFSDADVNKGGFSLSFLSEKNECAENNGNCSQYCRNLIGGYECYCEKGQELHSNGRNCEPACGRIFTEKDSNGIITSPSYPSTYPANRKCKWQIRAKPGYKIVLNITDFDLEDNKVCNRKYDYVEISGSSAISTEEKLLGRFCGAMDFKLIVSPSTKMTIEFNSDETVSGKGFRAVFVQDRDECEKDNGGCSQICENTVSSFKCLCKHGYKLGRNGRTCEPGACEKKIERTSGWIASPNYPKPYHPGESCTWEVKTVPGQRFNIKLQHINLASKYGRQCSVSYLRIQPKSARRRDPNNEFCGTTVPQTPLLLDGNVMKVSFKLGTQDAGGFNFSYSSVCGGSLMARKGLHSFYSHLNYGSKEYPSNQDCKWIIYSRKKKGKVRVRFKKFDLETGKCGDYDFAKIYDGRSTKAKLLGTLCGNKLKQTVFRSSGRYLLIHFRSDDSVNGKGFEVEYSKIRGRSKRHHYYQLFELKDSGRTRDFYY